MSAPTSCNSFPRIMEPPGHLDPVSRDAPRGPRIRGRRGRDQNQGDVEAKRLERAERKRAQDAAGMDNRIGEEPSLWELKYSFQEPVGDIRITEDWSGEGNGIAGLQWLGGVVLSRYMDSRQVFPEEYFVGCRVIEVGAGCGLTSIYAAMRGAHVTITDMDIDKCAENVETNLGPRGLESNTRVQRLEWASEEDLAACEPPYDMVIAGDCLYEEACIAPLLKLMWELSGPKTEILLCGVVGCGILNSFLSQVDSYFCRETVDTSLIDTLTDTREVGTTRNGQSRDRVGEGSTASEPVKPTEDIYEMRDSEGGQRPGQRALLRLRKKQETGDMLKTSEHELGSRLKSDDESSGERVVVDS